MGALGTDLTIATKIVVTKLKDKELYEIIYVYGNNEDFDCICLPFSCMPVRYKKETLCHYLQIFNTKNPKVRNPWDMSLLLYFVIKLICNFCVNYFFYFVVDKPRYQM